MAGRYATYYGTTARTAARGMSSPVRHKVSLVAEELTCRHKQLINKDLYGGYVGFS
jgi:hypothetical protein